MRLLGNQLDRTILLLLQHSSHRNFDDAQKLMRQQVQTKINGDRPYFESRCAWKQAFQARCPWDEDMGDFDYDGSHKLANLSLMWEKMVGYRRGMILECNGRCPREMVKSVVTYVKAKPVKIAPWRQRTQDVLHRISPYHLQIKEGCLDVKCFDTKRNNVTRTRT